MFIDEEHQGQIKKENVTEYYGKFAARSYQPNTINSPGDPAVVWCINAWMFVIHPTCHKLKGYTVIKDILNQSVHLHQNLSIY